MKKTLLITLLVVILASGVLLYLKRAVPLAPAPAQNMAGVATSLSPEQSQGQALNLKCAVVQSVSGGHKIATYTATLGSVSTYLQAQTPKQYVSTIDWTFNGDNMHKPYSSTGLIVSRNVDETKDYTAKIVITSSGAMKFEAVCPTVNAQNSVTSTSSTSVSQVASFPVIVASSTSVKAASSTVVSTNNQPFVCTVQKTVDDSNMTTAKYTATLGFIPTYLASKTPSRYVSEIEWTFDDDVVRLPYSSGGLVKSRLLPDFGNHTAKVKITSTGTGSTTATAKFVFTADCPVVLASEPNIETSEYSTTFKQINQQLNSLSGLFGIIENGKDKTMPSSLTTFSTTSLNYIVENFTPVELVTYKLGQNINLKPINAIDTNEHAYRYPYDLEGGSVPIVHNNPVVKYVWFGDDGIYSEGTSAADFWKGRNVSFNSLGRKFVRFFVESKNGNVYRSETIWFNIVK